MLNFIYIIFFTFLSALAQDCIPVDFGRDTPVCQCNSTYCDYYIDPKTPKNGEFIWYVTSKSGERLKRFGGIISKNSENNYNIRIDSNTQHQSVEGFGGAFTDSAGINIKKLSKGCQNHIMRSYFSSDGIKYNLGRVPIAGTDFSTRPYTYDDSPGDTELKDFMLAKEDYQYKMPFMKKALKLNPTLRFETAAWSAPPWMKRHNQINNFDYLLEEYYQVYANYIIKFLDEYKKNGFDMWTLSTGNEPFTPLVPSSNINSMYWSPATEATWIINNLGPTMKNSRFNNTGILIFDDQRTALPYFVSTIVNRYPKTLDYVTGIAVHWYTDYFISPDPLDFTHKQVPDKYILMTESCLGAQISDHPKVALGSWSRADELIKKLFENFNHWIVGWMDWNLVLDKQGGPNWVNNFVDAFIIVDPEKDVFYKQPTFYAFAHFSKFVPRSSVRISSNSADNSILTTAFKTTKDEVVVLVYNSSDEKKSVTINDPKVGNINIELPESSIHTILYKYE